MCRTTALCTAVLVAYKAATHPRWHLWAYLTHHQTVLIRFEFGPRALDLTNMHKANTARVLCISVANGKDCRMSLIEGNDPGMILGPFQPCRAPKFLMYTDILIDNLATKNGPEATGTLLHATRRTTRSQSLEISFSKRIYRAVTANTFTLLESNAFKRQEE
eukprot:6199593-Pleurochrysis_carterae.AAC.1